MLSCDNSIVNRPGCKKKKIHTSRKTHANIGNVSQ